MAELNHHIVPTRSAMDAATFYAEMLGLARPHRLGWFVALDVSATTTFYFLGGGPATSALHYAFLVEEPEFDAILDRVRARRLPYWADPAHGRLGDINHWDDGRGVYFDDLDGHHLEVHTRPYGAGGLSAALVHPLLLDGARDR